MYYSKANVYLKDTVLFDLNKFDVFLVDKQTEDALNQVELSFSKNNFNLENIKNNETYMNVYDTFYKENKIDLNEPTLENVSAAKIHVSNTCNLCCKYCYANEGNYNGADAIMDNDQALKICKFIKKNIPYIKTISFFGGEPFLAYDAIETICKEFEDSNINFNTQTNGTIYNDKISDLLKKYKIRTTVSIDGQKGIHDENRIDSCGNGTYDTIIDNLEKFSHDGYKFTSIQGTYTKNSQNSHSLYDVAKHLHNTTKIKFIKLEDVFTDDPELKVSSKNEIKNNIKNLSDFVEEGFILDNEILRFLRAFFTKDIHADKSFCEAGKDVISIDHKGDIWPCQLFINNHDYHMGSIDDHEKSKYVLNSLNNLKFSKFDECFSCIARCFCTICIGKENLCKKNNSSYINMDSLKQDCNYKKSIVEDILDYLSSLMQTNEFRNFNTKFVEIINSI